MISRTSRYALHVLGFLAARPGVRLSAVEIAGQTGIPANYLAKILGRLGKAGLVDAQKGWGGGFALQPEAAGRPLVDVVELFDGLGSANPGDCAYGRPRCNADNPCALHDDWLLARNTTAAMLTGKHVSDLVNR